MTLEDEGRSGRPLSDPELVQSQREVNEQLLLSALRAQEAAEAAAEREASLRAAAELRELLIGILGHDLRTPLGAMMMGAGRLVANGSLNEVDARIAVRILSSGNRMKRMISQILEFTRLRMGSGLEIDREPSDLGALCGNVAEELELAASVRVRCVVNGDTRASVDVDRITEAVANIAGNAVEHAAIGSAVEIVASGDGEGVVVEIQNLGAPIAPDVLPILFEPFRRAKVRVPSQAGNLGLGLYIAHEVVRGHGGTIEARSAGGKTTFTLRLPRGQGGAPG